LLVGFSREGLSNDIFFGVVSYQGCHRRQGNKHIFIGNKFIGKIRLRYIKIGSHCYQWGSLYDRMPSRWFTGLQKKVPTLVYTHCVVHCEDLVTSDAFKVVPELLILDDFANKVYIWVGRSCR
jgi:hypothetical protein